MDQKILEGLAEMGYTPLKEDDVFRFGCRRCGRCCCNRTKPINLMGYDIYNLAKDLGRTPLEILQRYTSNSIGPTSMMRIVYLRERSDGTCPLLYKNKCSVQRNKPVVCRVYPLGRVCAEGQIVYMIQDNPCHGKDYEIKVSDWIDLFHLRELDEVSIAEHELFIASLQLAQEIKATGNDALLDRFREKYYQTVYLGMDIDAPYLDSVRRATARLSEEFPDLDIAGRKAKGLMT